MEDNEFARQSKEAVENIVHAAERTGVEYMRVVRDSDGCAGADAVFAETLEDAIAWLKAHPEGKILAATGSKELDKYVEIPDYRSRVYARVLSTADSVVKAAELGFEGKNLIAMQGPFSREMNKALIRQYNIRYMVTKESGNTGGYADKIAACRECGINSIKGFIFIGSSTKSAINIPFNREHHGKLAPLVKGFIDILLIF